jgi:hypothetical protein
MSIEEKQIAHMLTGKASQAEFIETLVGWMFSDAAMNTDGMYEASTRRVLWKFENNLALVIGTSFPLTLVHLDEEVTDSTPSRFLPTYLAKQWKRRAHANGWVLDKEQPAPDYSALPTPPDYGEIQEWIELLSTLFDTPELIIPWDYPWYHAPLDYGEEFYEDYADDLEEGQLDGRKMLVYLASSIEAGTLQAVSPWSINMVDGWEGLPYHCDLSRYLRVIQAIEESKLMIVDIDQHCAGCASGVYEQAIEQDPELEGKSIFRTFGQNSEYMFLGDGAIFIEATLPVDAPEKELKELFEREGLYMGLPDALPDWTPTGGVEYESGYLD